MTAQWDSILGEKAPFFNARDWKDLHPMTYQSRKIKIGISLGRELAPGEVACTMSHIGALKYAKEMGWPFLIVFEDDIIISSDIKDRIAFLFRLLPPDWEHVYLSGSPHINYYPNLLIPNIQPSVYTNRTDGMIIRASAYDKVIRYLEGHWSTTDAMYSHLIVDKNPPIKGLDNNLRSYTYYPFVSIASDEYSYIWDRVEKREDNGAKYYRESL
jgi:GR25 family glycosyltransferase involved in LPS biosynthesis